MTVHVIERPGVLERCTGGFTPNGRGVVLIRVKRRVQVDHIHDIPSSCPRMIVEVIADKDTVLFFQLGFI